MTTTPPPSLVPWELQCRVDLNLLGDTGSCQRFFGPVQTFAGVGQMRGTHVHKLSGEYVGELHEDMVVDKHMGNYGNIGNPGNPGNPGSPGNPGNRGNRGCPYPDAFGKLLS